MNLRAKLLDYSIILILLCLLAFSPWPYGSVGLAAQYFLHLVSLSALLLWLIRKKLSSEGINYHPAYLPQGLFFILLFLSIFFSVYRWASIIEFLNLTSFLIIFFIVIQTINSERRKRLLFWAINIVGLFYCLYGILQYFGHLPKDFWTQSDSLSSRFINSGPFGAFINLNLFLSLAMVFACKRLIPKMFCFAFFCIFGVTLILSKSRISWIACALSLVVFLVSALKKLKVKNVKGYIFMIISVIIIGFIIFYNRLLIWQRIYIALPTQFQSLQQRLDVWKGTLGIIAQRPFGAGIGIFQYIYPAYRIHSDRFFVDYAHNDFLQIAAELGIPGLAVFVWFLIKLAWQAKKVLFTLPNFTCFISIGLLCALTAFIIQGIVDFPLHIPADAILFFIFLALLAGLTFCQKVTIFPLSRYLNASVLVVILICGLSFTSIFLSRRYYLQAQKDYAHMDWNQALLNYAQSIRLAPLYADAYAGRGGIYTLKATLDFDARQKEKYRKLALSDFSSASKLNPYQFDYYLNLGWLYEEDGKLDEAIFALSRAIKTNPSSGLPYYVYADYCLGHNLIDEGLAAYRKAFSLFTEEKAYYRFFKGTYNLFEKIYSRIPDYQRLRQAIPDEVLGVRLEFADFLEKKNMISESYQEYKDILAKFPQSEAAKEALKRIGK